MDQQGYQSNCFEAISDISHFFLPLLVPDPLRCITTPSARSHSISGSAIKSIKPKVPFYFFE
jgi:hypothetical protein